MKSVSSFAFRVSRVTAPAAVLVVCMALMLGMTACNDEHLHKAAQASAGISAGLKTLAQATVTNYKAGVLDKDEAIALALGVEDATLANDQFVARLRSLQKIDETNRVQIVGWFQEVDQSLAKLNEQGVLRIKNPEAKQRMAVIFASISGAAEVIKALLAQTQTANAWDRPIMPPNIEIPRLPDGWK